jgi:hypothetical protein
MAQGDFLLHLGPERRERLRKAAEAEGMSMSAYVLEALDVSIDAGQPGPASLTAALRLVERAARQLAESGPVPELGTPAGDHWDRMLTDGGPG